jgi:hypothetical protein
VAKCLSLSLSLADTVVSSLVLEVLFQRTIVMKRQCPACKEFVRGNATVCKECGHYFMPKGANDA